MVMTHQPEHSGKVMTCRVSIFLLLLLLIAWAASSGAVEIVSVSPLSAAPGERVSVSLVDDEDPYTLLLNGQGVPVEASGPGFASFRVPLVPAGTYALRLLSGGTVVPTPYQLTVLEPTPNIVSLTPANIPECAEREEKRVDVIGRYFFTDSRLLVNGALVDATFVGPQQMSFDASSLTAGVYGVQVVNPSGLKSLPYSLYVNSIPTIREVSTGENYTSHYELVIRGGNFFQQSTLLVTEAPPGMTGLSPRQRVIWGKGRRSGAGFLLDEEKEDYLYFEDCHTLVYYRYPLSGQPRELTLKVINPDGKASGAYELLAN